MFVCNNNTGKSHLSGFQLQFRIGSPAVSRSAVTLRGPRRHEQAEARRDVREFLDRLTAGGTLEEIRAWLARMCTGRRKAHAVTTVPRRRRTREEMKKDAPTGQKKAGATAGGQRGGKGQSGNTVAAAPKSAARRGSGGRRAPPGAAAKTTKRVDERGGSDGRGGRGSGGR